MKKKKVIEINIPDEKFEIPQINFTLDGIIKGKSKFFPSEIASPFHGTNVVDRKHYIDNSGLQWLVLQVLRLLLQIRWSSS